MTGLPRGWSARHINVDGYANAWLVDGTGDADLTITYGPVDGVTLRYWFRCWLR